MALIKRFDIEMSPIENIQKPAHRATLGDFKLAGNQPYITIRTYGHASRKHPEKPSQVIQLGPEAIAQLKRILEEMR